MRLSRSWQLWLVPSLLLLAAAAVSVRLRAADPAQHALGPPPAAKPSLVTLQMDATLDQVLDELQKQTDIAVDRSRADASRPAKIAVRQVPFWEALEKIAKSSDHRIVFAEQGRSIMLVTGEGVTYRALPLAIDGVFRIAARRVQATYDLEQGRSLYEVQLALHWEPKFSAFLVDQPGKNVTARDNTGRDLPVAEGHGRIAVSGGGTLLHLRLNDVPRASRTIQRLEGSFGVVGAAKMLRYEFAKVGLQEQAQTQDGVTVKVKADFKEGADLWKARVEFEYPEGGPKLESFETGAWLSENHAFLLSNDNRRRLDVNGGSDYETQGERRAIVNYHWVPPDEGKFGKPSDWRLVVRTPSRLIEVPVKFKLENIPLP